MESIIVNVLVGIIAIVGFFIYWGKSSGIFKDGGFFNEWWKNFRNNKKEERTLKKDLKNEEK